MKKIRLALEWFLNPDHVPFLVALEKGWFKEAGIELELIEPKEHFDAFSAMRKGEVDVAITEPIHLTQDVAKGESLVGFARFLHTNGGVMFLERSGIERPRDMASKRVQYPGAPGPGGLAIVETMIRADGGDPGKLVPVNNGFLHTDALLDDKADVATLVFYNFEVVEAEARGAAAKFFALKDWGVPDFCQLILIAEPRFLDERAEDVATLVKILRRGIDALQQDPDGCRKIYFSRTGTALDEPLMSAIYRATTPSFCHDFSMSKDYYDSLGRWLVETGQSPASPAYEALWTNRWAV